jgi:hypothetical protein
MMKPEAIASSPSHLTRAENALDEAVLGAVAGGSASADPMPAGAQAALAGMEYEAELMQQGLTEALTY